MKQVQLTITPLSFNKPPGMLNKKTGRNRNCNKGVKCQLYVKRRAKTRTERDQLNYGKHS